MNLSSPTQALQARAQPGGITPELIRLLAQMKVKQETDAAARDMAMKTGQQPPTVAEGLNAELEGNWRQKLEQKLGGLNALAQQQAPQGAPTMPGPPAQPTQHMARGGLAKLRSNLPGSYAGGGIVAFEDGGPAWKNLERRPDETSSEYVARIERAKAEDPSFSATAGPAALLKALDPAALLKALFSHRGPGAYPEEPNDVAVPDVSRQQLQGVAAPQPAVASWVDAPASVQPDRRAPSAVAAQPGAGGATRVRQPVVAQAQAQPAGLQAPVEEGLRAAMSANQRTAEDTAANEYAARHQSALGADQAALIAARQQDYEQAKAAHEARMAKSAPSIWDRMGTLGRNAGYGQWGKAAGDQRTMELEHEARGASGLEALLKRKGEVDAMALADKKEAFGATEGKRSAAGTAVASAKQNALDRAGQLVATQGTNATQLKIAQMQAASHANDMAQRRIDSLDGKTAQLYARSHDIAMKQATDASNKFAESLVGGVTRPGETPESVFTKVYNQAMMTVPGYTPIKNAVADSGMGTKMAEVAAELARRKGGK